MEEVSRWVVLVTSHNFDPILLTRKKTSKMDFVKMMLAMAASHLGGLALCALYAGTPIKN